ncbi:MAG: ATP synthase F1 subunit epsilon [Candidatus Moraniibacteriota bacterium]|nr:MAG: ATP synthase F1 subunit epsilon [Candidatus Moranbacteria bacterium]
MEVKIITPKKVVFEQTIDEITLPASDGEITILPRHVALFSMLKEGVVTILKGNEETFFSIGGGYVETDGKQVSVLVSRAFGQDEIDEAEIKRAQKQAEELLAKNVSEQERTDALQMLRRSTIDLQLLSKVKRKRKA